MILTAKKNFFKILKITGIAVLSLLVLMFLLPILFPNFVARKIKIWANEVIVTDLNFSKARLSFFNHFPSLTLTLYDVSIKGSAPFEKDDHSIPMLITANELNYSGKGDLSKSIFDLYSDMEVDSFDLDYDSRH